MSQTLPYLLHNGAFITSEQPLFTPHNRGYRYGDGLFESMRFVQGKLQFAQRHLQRLMTGANLMQYSLPDNFIAKSLEEWCKLLAEKNQITGSARVRLSVYRNDGGYYKPLDNSASWIIEMWSMDTDHYAINDKGISVELFQDVRKPVNKLSGMKSANAALYVLGALFAQKMNVDDAVLINQNGNVIEATGSSLFAVKNGVLYTSPLSEGCVAGVMRAVVMELAQQHRIAVYEVPLPLSVLLNSDEIFLTNAVHGIVWVSAYRNKRYFSTTAKKINELLNANVAKN